MKKKIGRFEGLPQFKWNDLRKQDVIFITKYTRNKDGDSARKVETVVVKKLLGSSPAFKNSPFQRFPILQIPYFKDSHF